MSHAERAGFLRAFAEGPGPCPGATTSAASPAPASRASLHEVAEWSAVGRRRDVLVLRRAGRHVPVRGAGHAHPPAVRSACWSGSRSASSGPSSRGTPPSALIANKVAPALIAGCTVVLKASPEAPGEAYVVAEVAESIGLPPGVLNVAHRRPGACPSSWCDDPGSTRSPSPARPSPAASIAALCGERMRPVHPRAGRQVSRGDPRRRRTSSVAAKSAWPSRSRFLSRPGVLVAHPDHRVEVPARLAGRGSGRQQMSAREGRRPVRTSSQMGPLVAERQRDRVLGYIAQGGGRWRDPGGGRRPAGRAGARAGTSSRRCSATWPTRRPSPRRRSSAPCSVGHPGRVARTTRCGIANDTIYGLNASVFTPDVDRARAVASRLRSGHRRPQRLPHRLRHRLRRLQAVRHRPGGRHRGHPPVPRDQDRHPRGHPHQPLTVPSWRLSQQLAATATENRCLSCPLRTARRRDAARARGTPRGWARCR